MGEGVGEAVGGQAALLQAQGIAAAAQLQVLLGDQEAVVGVAQHVEPALAGVGKRRVIEQDAGALARAPSDPASQLVQLGEAEPLGLLDHHDRGVGHVDADLDHGRRHQHRKPPFGEIGHHRVLLLGGQGAVDQAHA